MRYIVVFVLLTLTNGSTAQKVEQVILSACDENSILEYMYRNRLISRKISNDTLCLHLGIVRDCGLIPKIDCLQTGDTLSLFIQNDSDSWTACFCCYELDVQLSGVLDTNFTLTIDGSVAKQVRNKYFFPAPQEIEAAQPENKLDPEGRKTGVWRINYEAGNQMKVKAYYFIDEYGVSRVGWSVRYDENGKLTEISKLTYIDENRIGHLIIARGEEYERMKFE